nr:hypothetical protein [Tanacetum cinerariifolium]
DVTRLQALVDKKKVVVTEATIREALCLDDEEGDLSTHTTKYTSPALTQKVFKNMRRVDKGFSRVKTPLFEGMLIEQQVAEEGDADEHVEEVNAGDAAKGDVNAAHGEVLTVVEEPSIPSPTPPTQTPQPPPDIPSTSQLKRRVKKLERRNKVRVLKLRRLQKVGTSQRVETSNETTMDDESNQGRMIAEMDQDDDVVLEDDKEDDKEVVDVVKDKDETKPAEVQEVVDVVTTAKLITEVVTVASETITAANAIITTAKAQVPAATLTAAPAKVVVAPSRRRKGVVIRDLQEKSTTSTIIPAETKSKDKELHAELNKDIDWDEVIYYVKIKAKEDPVVKKYQALKRKPQTEGQARKNMMLYLKNTKEQIEEDENKSLQKLNETLAERAAKRRKLDEESSESNFDNLSFLRPPPEPPDVEFDFELDAREEISVVMNDNDELECLDPRDEIDNEDDYFPFM